MFFLLNTNPARVAFVEREREAELCLRGGSKSG